MSTGMLIDGILGSEAIDSSGEVLSVEGADISDAAAGTMLLNWEHEPGKKGAQTIVGQVLYAKKIFSEQDCSGDRERMYWKKVKVPFIYGVSRLYDGAGHENAKAIAAIIRDNTANGELVVCRFSVEGQTMESENGFLKTSAIRRCAVTVSPCNRTANSGLLQDPNAPEGYKKTFVKEKDILDFDDTEKSEFQDPRFTRLGGSVGIEGDPVIKAEDLDKMGVGAPGAMAGNDVLACSEEKQSLAQRTVKALQSYKRPFVKDEFRAYLKAELPEASDEFLEHFVNAAENVHVPKRVAKSIQSDVLRAKINQSAFRYRLQGLTVDLNHALQKVRGPATPQDLSAYMPDVECVHVKVGDQFHPAGRYLVHNNTITHLEDYHGLLQAILPQGPMDAHSLARIYAMSSNPNLSVHKDDPNDEIPNADTEQVTEGSPETEESPQRPASVFEYHRVGMASPHTVEVVDGTYLLDGNRLDPHEVQTILDNARNGTAKIRYKVSTTERAIAKMESVIQDLMKAVDVPDQEHLDLHDALSAVRERVAAGQMDPKHERTLTRHLYEDRMTPGIGNKNAANEFGAKKKPGVYVQMDGNDFSAINNAFGHEAGNSAIKAFGKAAREAMDEAIGRGPGGGKLFRNPSDPTDGMDMYRNGGDEFLAHVPSHEHAAKFARLLSQKLDAVPPIGGTHKLSMSFGFGQDPHTADKALYKAKEQKYHPGQESVPSRERVRAHDLGKAPNLAHSLIPGAEGPVPVHSPQAAAVHETMMDPKVASPSVPKTESTDKA